MNIFLVSWSDPSIDLNGVSLSSRLHRELLIELGHEVYSIYPREYSSIDNHDLSNIFYIKASGSGALYNKTVFDFENAKQLLLTKSPDLVLCESWQNCLTENFIELAYLLKIPVAVISHGLSVSPFSAKVLDILRSLGWVVYKLKFKNLLKKLNFVTTLSEDGDSTRLYDTQLAYSIGVKVYKLNNAPINFIDKYCELSNRNNNILIIGYYSYIKNQLLALEIARSFSHCNFNFIFIGKKEGSYYDKCIKYTKKFKLENVLFLSDDECNLPELIAKSRLVLCTSLTEVLPLTLLESIACGTPFVSSNVGAISSLVGGLIVKQPAEYYNLINNLMNDDEQWKNLSINAKIYYNENYTRLVVRQQLHEILNNISS